MTDQEKPSYKVQWQADKDQPELAQKLRDSWGQIIDPELGLSIIQLGLIRDVSIQEDRAQVTMLLTTPFCPYGPAMIETTRHSAEEALSRPIMIEIGEGMWDMSMMEGDAEASWGMYY
ncbi:MAG: iron-sulfur cluster assembly protein [Anaerolineales bacterium]|jgi:metal-sulfur cluster biosynthetic enzyme